MVPLVGAAANTETGSVLPATDTSARAGGGNGAGRDRGSRLFASSCSTKDVSPSVDGVTPDAPAAATDSSAATKAAERRDMA